ncbi:MAG: glycosyltransferase, partial [Dysgonamonadaceae bacterium]|nr:glycosyltransferase [Dysgonamonadaceae bacterium]
TDERKKHGWIKSDFGKTTIIIDPDDKTLRELLSQKEAIHVFSGIGSFELPAKAFKIAVKNKLKIGVILEPFNWIGWKGKLRFFKYFLLRLKYNQSIDFLLTIGNIGRWRYEKVGFSKIKIFDWGYFTETVDTKIIYNSSSIISLLFIGSLDYRKNILSLVDACLSISNDKPFILNIIGNGPLECELKDKIKNSNTINYLGTVPNTEIFPYISQSDALILPSIFDGWGAVVNEALMCGTPVITSNNCGASVLLDNKERGYVFSVKKNNLQEVIINFLKQLPYSIDEKQKIRNWALKAISGEVAAQYFIQICEYLYEHKGNNPVAPWIKDKQ